MEALRIPIGDGASVSAALEAPARPRAALSLAHGAGAGMDHRFLRQLSPRLADRGIACLRFNFPYTDAGRKFPDRSPVLERTVGCAAAFARDRLPDVPVLAGGKSMGGRMTSRAAAQGALPAAAGIVFLGFPLQPPRPPRRPKPGAEGRADHLAAVPLPMLFIQGTRDKLAPLPALRPVIEDLGDRASLHVVDGADHGFDVLVRSGRTADDVQDEIADAIARWATDVGARR